MLNQSEHIIVARDAIKSSPWHITNPRLKLALKYGLGSDGPWRPPQSNWSVAFDAYALKRGPRTGLPTLADFAITRLMNSRVTNRDIGTLGSWLAVKGNFEKLGSLQIGLAKVEGLHRADNKTVRQIGALVGRAKIFKWLSAWAPDHIPMLDPLHFISLGGNETIALK
jgi:hypothetical protein